MPNCTRKGQSVKLHAELYDEKPKLKQPQLMDLWRKFQPDVTRSREVRRDSGGTSGGSWTRRSRQNLSPTRRRRARIRRPPRSHRQHRAPVGIELRLRESSLRRRRRPRIRRPSRSRRRTERPQSAGRPERPRGRAPPRLVEKYKTSYGANHDNNNNYNGGYSAGYGDNNNNNYNNGYNNGNGGMTPYYGNGGGYNNSSNSSYGGNGDRDGYNNNSSYGGGDGYNNNSPASWAAPVDHQGGRTPMYISTREVHFYGGPQNDGEHDGEQRRRGGGGGGSSGFFGPALGAVGNFVDRKFGLNDN